MKYLILLLCLGCAQVATADCPLGPGDSQLVFPQIMINFGKFISKADDVVRDGTDFPGDVTAQNLTDAAGALDVAISCADRVLAPDPVLPDKVAEMSPQEAKAYVAQLQSYMSHFRGLLTTYEQAVKAMTSTSTKQDYEAAYADSQAVWDWAGEAHAHL